MSSTHEMIVVLYLGNVNTTTGRTLFCFHYFSSLFFSHEKLISLDLHKEANIFSTTKSISERKFEILTPKLKAHVQW